MINEQIHNQVRAAAKGAIRETAAEVLDQMGIEEMSNKLLGIPGEIRKLQTQMADAQKEVDNVKRDVELEKSLIVAGVTSEVYENGKPVFSNEKTRNAEITRRMSENQDYLTAIEALDEAEGQVTSLRFDIDRLNSDMANLRAVVSARAAQIQVLFGN
jgi:DNA repair exonuclease SbcCD ATPase subunit